MAAISTQPQTTDSTRAYVVTAHKVDGTAYAFAGTEALACRVAPRGGGATLATPDVAFLVAASGTLTVTVRAAQVSGLGPGTYNIEVLATPASGAYSGEPLSVWSGTIALEAGGAAAATTAGWTVLKLERLLARSLADWLSACEMDLAASGSNADLAGPIGAAIEHFGGTVSDPARVADADLATVAGSERAVVDVARYLTVEACIGNWASVSLSYQTSKANYDDLATRMRDEAARLLERLKRMHGFGAAPPQFGVVDLDFQQDWSPTLPWGMPW